MSIAFKCRDIGYGVETGRVELPALSPPDWTGKREYRTVDGETVYLFDDELEFDGPLPHVAEKIEPGAILYSSWGYDQTNIDFYYVTRVTEKSAWIVPMSSVHHDNGPGYSSMSEDVTAGEPLWFQDFCECRHHQSHHNASFGCMWNDYGNKECECSDLRPVPNKPEMHRIQRWEYGGKIRESLHLTSYSSASLWEGGKLYASHYA